MVWYILACLEMLQTYGAIGPNDTLEKRLEILIALFDPIAKPTADALREQLKIVHEFHNKPSP